jgi:chromosome segregation ATPase
MNDHLTLCNINMGFFTEHLPEMIIMLTGTMLISFFAGSFFAKGNKAKDVKAEETSEFVLASTASEPDMHTTANAKFETAIQPLQQETRLKEEQWQAETLTLQQQLQTYFKEIVDLENKRDILAKTVEVQQKSLHEKEKDLEDFKTEAGELKNTVVQLRSDNQKLNEELSVLINTPVSVTEITTEQLTDNGVAGVYTEKISSLEANLASLAEKNQLLQEQLERSEQQMLVFNSPDGEDENSMIAVLRDKLTDVQKEKAAILQQAKNLENQFVVNHLASMSKVEFSEESEQNPFRRISLYIRMTEGEKTGLQNKIDDLTKKLQQAEAGVKLLAAMENELAFLKARVNALEQDKKEYGSKAGEWEIMYRKLHEKTVYIISSKETEIEQLKTNIGYLEKDKTGLLKRLNSLENDIKSNLFFKNDKPFALNI